MRFSELADRRVGVWGAGREAQSLARHAGGATLAVVATDAPAPEAALAPFLAAGAAAVSGADVLPALRRCEVVVRSPGISIHRPEVRALAAARVPVVTATGLWLAEPPPAPVIGVTGTKGKSTTASLAAHLLRAAGRRVELAGNVGRPALDLLDAPVPDVYVIELSSYQIADLDRGPQIALFTNLYREHLDWHGSEAAYRADKLRLADLPGVEGVVVNGADPGLAALARRPGAVAFGVPGGFHATVDGVRDGAALVLPAAGAPLPGAHNLLNVAAALAALRRHGVEVADVAAALAGFRGLPHRLEVIGERAGVTWVDDSISTTPESALAALAAFAERPVVLIGGGHDRGQDYARLGAELSRRGARVIGLPETGARLLRAARAAGLAAERATPARSMEEAVALARDGAPAGAVVLLSPAAPSFGAYPDFEARGRHFRDLWRSGP